MNHVEKARWSWLVSYLSWDFVTILKKPLKSPVLIKAPKTITTIQTNSNKVQNLTKFAYWHITEKNIKPDNLVKLKTLYQCLCQPNVLQGIETTKRWNTKASFWISQRTFRDASQAQIPSYHRMQKERLLVSGAHLRFYKYNW